MGLDAILTFVELAAIFHLLWILTLEGASCLCVLKEPWALVLFTLLFVSLLVSCLHCLCLELLLSSRKWRKKGVSPPNVSLLGCVRIVTCCMLCVDCKPKVAVGCRISRLDGGVKSGTCS